ncbi:tumor necrosis factor receptor superfamily member 14 isoform X2 [Rhinatrema bivittatum]|nr:tumor necrosis factor receptor superfamily member 14 isoform X2 [Rhinatrema bivittatum]
MVILMGAEICFQGEYSTGTGCCPMCQAGTRVRNHCKETSGTNCIPCMAGTYMDHPSGLTDCFKCKICDTGMGLTEKQKCTYVKNTVCDCESGFYCAEPQEEDCELCQRWTSCEPGYYVGKPGTETKDTVCERCPDGTFSMKYMSEKCEPWTRCSDQNKIKEKAGTLTSDSVCKDKDMTGVIISAVTVFIVLIAVICTILLIRFRAQKGHFDLHFSDLCKKKAPGKVEEVSLCADNTDGRGPSAGSRTPCHNSHVSSREAETDNRKRFPSKGKETQSQEAALLQPPKSGNATVIVHQTVNISLPAEDTDMDSGVHCSEELSDLTKPIEETGR